MHDSVLQPRSNDYSLTELETLRQLTYFSLLFIITSAATTAAKSRKICASIAQALFLCNICVVFRPVLAFRDLLFIHASTNATDDHKYSPLPSADFDSSEVLVSFSAFVFS